MTIVLQAIRHGIEISSAIYFDLPSGLVSPFKFVSFDPTLSSPIIGMIFLSFHDSTPLQIFESSSLILTGCWVWQMLNYEPIKQIRDGDLNDETEL